MAIHHVNFKYYVKKKNYEIILSEGIKKHYTYYNNCAQSLQSCPILCDLMDYSLPDSSVHGITQARILVWVAISSSKGSSWSRDWTHWQPNSLPTEHYNNYSYVKWYVHGDKQLSTLSACPNLLRNVKNVKHADASEFLI